MGVRLGTARARVVVGDWVGSLPAGVVVQLALDRRFSGRGVTGKLSGPTFPHGGGLSGKCLGSAFPPGGGVSGKSPRSNVSPRRGSLGEMPRSVTLRPLAGAQAEPESARKRNSCRGRREAPEETLYCAVQIRARNTCLLYRRTKGRSTCSRRHAGSLLERFRPFRRSKINDFQRSLAGSPEHPPLGDVFSIGFWGLGDVQHDILGVRSRCA